MGAWGKRGHVTISAMYLQIEIQPAVVKAASDEAINASSYQRSTDAFEEKPVLAPLARMESFNENVDDVEDV